VSRRLPLVVLVGRPNVGKSTLFNRMTGTRRAIVTSVPGTTRDVLEQVVSGDQRDFTLLDTGGMFGASDDPLHELVVERGRFALDQADVVVMVFDGEQGLVPGDHEIVQRVRALNVPTIAVVNKVDVRRARDSAMQFYELGFEPLIEVSAEHATGVGDLLDEIAKRLPGERTPGRPEVVPPPAAPPEGGGAR